MERTAVQEPVAAVPDVQQEEERRAAHRADVKTSSAAEVDPAYRGFKGGAAFFGWLIAVGLTVLITGILVAVAAGVDYAVTFERSTFDAHAGVIAIAAAAVVIVMLAIACYNGGYVAGRLARFDGARQAFGVWAIGLVVVLIAVGLGVLADSQYDLVNRLDLPSVPISDAELRTGGVIAGAALLVVTLLAALVGGKAGQRYHRRIDNSWD
jgi:amino acid transporter